MSVKVDLDQLVATLDDYAFGYLITVSDDHRAHTVAVDPVLRNGVFGVGGVGNSTRRNASAHPHVTMVWPPNKPGGYSLIIDGLAEFIADQLQVTPQHAVLHRPAVPGVPTASGCGDDCVPL
ncbi:pyridoxamine 5'-phosphate oxidase family protein [Mycobacterium sp. NBC_00419]|uniref:pyridoxamine 5'-phosphate oxidase family protein n=1 Tax=Mycobacterium sp. NBC_00419 TaxID=2975989 RepID=UPI002E1F5986